MFGSNLILSDKIVDHIFVIMRTKAFGIDGGRLVLGLFYILDMWRLFSAGTPLLSFLKNCYLV